MKTRDITTPGRGFLLSLLTDLSQRCFQALAQTFNGSLYVRIVRKKKALRFNSGITIRPMDRVHFSLVRG